MLLTLGPGPGSRLLAPGAPDWIGADGVRVGWVLRDRLFLWEGQSVRVVELPDLAEDVVADAAGWVVALGNGFVRVDPVAANIASLLVDDDADPVTTRPGLEAGLLVEVPEQRLLRLDDGTSVPLPDAALRAKHLRPWARGVGACWVDFDTLYRLGTRVSALGRAPGPEGIAVGPDGAVAVMIKNDTVVAGPRSLAMKVGRRLDVSRARFSPDGTRMAAPEEDGVALVELETGKVLQSWKGELVPVGWGPQANGDIGLLLWEGGSLVDAAGTVLLDGFAGAVPACAGRILVGPGGAAWDVETGERRGPVPADVVYATDGERIVSVDDTTFGVLGGTRHPHELVQGDDTVAAARIDGEDLLITTEDGETGRFAVGTGDRRKRGRGKRSVARFPAGVTVASREEPSALTIGETTWPLPADGVSQVGAGWWVWTNEGMLVQVGG